MKINSRPVLIGMAALLVGVYLQLFGFNLPVRNSVPDARNIEGFFWPHQKPLTDFSLVDQNNEPFRLANLRGKWSFLFFGYTHCPDICPVTMSVLREVNTALENDGDKDLNDVNFVFVSVDPERDSPSHIKTYVEFFNSRFIGITGSKQQVDTLTMQFGVPYMIDAHEPGDTDYLVGHSGALFLVSPDGSLASIFQMPHHPDKIFDRFTRINKFMENQS